MSTKQKKLTFYTSMGLMGMIVCLLGWKLLTVLGIIGLSDASHMYARSTVPFGFVLVLFIPIIATITLFFGLANTKK
ncbi:hypothetical protein [Enterococcus olivae]